MELNTIAPTEMMFCSLVSLQDDEVIIRPKSKKAKRPAVYDDDWP